MAQTQKRQEVGRAAAEPSVTDLVSSTDVVADILSNGENIGIFFFFFQCPLNSCDFSFVVLVKVVQ